MVLSFEFETSAGHKKVPEHLVKMFEGDLWVGYAKFFGKGNRLYPQGVVLRDFEIRPSHRGKGLSVELFKQAEKELGFLYATGCFSRAGLKTFPKTCLRMIPGMKIDEPSTSEFSFVNWPLGQFN